eukprot:TRINITY_DN23714_c0_g2_i1.p1 TRINITY_DN23714_c0_g2~~TRINITY_DN23714_c0_g2_i1.p1  ORF type:complete len:964 (+),score=177.62 TRINITY_DN23714_c0_g2_i1:64-2892(+)
MTGAEWERGGARRGPPPVSCALQSPPGGPPPRRAPAASSSAQRERADALWALCSELTVGPQRGPAAPAGGGSSWAGSTAPSRRSPVSSPAELPLPDSPGAPLPAPRPAAPSAASSARGGSLPPPRSAAPSLPGCATPEYDSAAPRATSEASPAVPQPRRASPPPRKSSASASPALAPLRAASAGGSAGGRPSAGRPAADRAPPAASPPAPLPGPLPAAEAAAGPPEGPPEGLLAEVLCADTPERPSRRSASRAGGAAAGGEAQEASALAAWRISPSRPARPEPPPASDVTQDSGARGPPSEHSPPRRSAPRPVRGLLYSPPAAAQQQAAPRLRLLLSPAPCPPPDGSGEPPPPPRPPSPPRHRSPGRPATADSGASPYRSPRAPRAAGSPGRARPAALLSPAPAPRPWPRPARSPPAAAPPADGSPAPPSPQPAPRRGSPGPGEGARPPSCSRTLSFEGPRAAPLSFEGPRAAALSFERPPSCSGALSFEGAAPPPAPSAVPLAAFDAGGSTDEAEGDWEGAPARTPDPTAVGAVSCLCPALPRAEWVDAVSAAVWGEHFLSSYLPVNAVLFREETVDGARRLAGGGWGAAAEGRARRVGVTGPKDGGKSTALHLAAAEVLLPELAVCPQSSWERTLVLPLNWDLHLPHRPPPHDLPQLYCMLAQHFVDLAAGQRPCLRRWRGALASWWKRVATQRRAEPLPRGFAADHPRAAALFVTAASGLRDALQGGAAGDALGELMQLPEVLRDAFGFTWVLWLQDNLPSACATVVGGRGDEASLLDAALSAMSHPRAQVLVAVGEAQQGVVLPRLGATELPVGGLVSDEALLQSCPTLPRLIRCGNRQYPLSVFGGCPGYLAPFVRLMEAHGADAPAALGGDAAKQRTVEFYSAAVAALFERLALSQTPPRAGGAASTPPASCSPPASRSPVEPRAPSPTGGTPAHV